MTLSLQAARDVGAARALSLPGLVLAALPQPLLVLLPDRSLVFANGGAEALFTARRAERVGGRLTGLGQLSAQKLDELLRLAANGQAASAALWFRPGLETGWLQLFMSRQSFLRGSDWPGDSLLMLIHIDEPALSQTARIDALCHQCRLTRTERYVLMLLADGQTVESAAQQLELQISTMRSHVRNLLGKTHAPSLMQLVRWLGSAQSLRVEDARS